jgi:hypothetical protein
MYKTYVVHETDGWGCCLHHWGHDCKHNDINDMLSLCRMPDPVIVCPD